VINKFHTVQCNLDTQVAAVQLSYALELNRKG